MEKNILGNEIWNKLIKAFSDEGLDYVLVGGAALAIHGLPRSTIDIDIFIESKEENVKKIFKIADKLGLVTEQKDILKLVNSPNVIIGQWICFTYEEQDILDVYFTDNKEFNELKKNTIKKHDKTVSVTVVSLETLQKMKNKSKRPIDLADIELIKDFNGHKNDKPS